MFHLFETIKVTDDVIHQLPWHQQRVDKSFMALYGTSNSFKLRSTIIIPPEYKKGTIKCRFEYNETSFQVECSPYIPRAINTVKIVHALPLEYPYKYTDRTGINSLFEQRGECDEILIVKNGLITDTSIANIMFTDGISWFTPSLPLLPGTCRARLLDSGYLKIANITIDNYARFTHFKLINAMHISPAIEVDNIIK